MIPSGEVEKLADMAEKIYPFAHALFPDDLLAHQLVVDGISRTLLSESQSQNMDWKRVCAHVFDLAKRRSEHATPIDIPKGAFFQLNLFARAALFLKYIYQMEALEATGVLGLELTDFWKHLYQGKRQLD